MSMIVDVVMQHLLSKDVLYQPMKVRGAIPGAQQQTCMCTDRGIHDSTTWMAGHSCVRRHSQSWCVRIHTHNVTGMWHVWLTAGPCVLHLSCRR